jgi:polypeptide N-acetylgalactosaminyltransferase
MNKRVFCCGFFFGVIITWILSFYLYYSLNTPQTLKVYRDFQKNIFNSDDFDDSNEDFLKANNLINNKEVEGKVSYVKKKYDKEKSKRKLSRKLIEELTPVTSRQFSEFGIIKNVEDQIIRDDGYKTHAFNVLVSNQIGITRQIPDTRNKM